MYSTCTYWLKVAYSTSLDRFLQMTTLSSSPEIHNSRVGSLRIPVLVHVTCDARHLSSQTLASGKAFLAFAGNILTASYNLVDGINEM